MSRAFSKILILVILIILAGGGIFAWQYFGVTKEKIEVPGEEIAGDETANWQTYQNKKFGFEIKYPEGTKITDVDVGRGYFFMQIPFSPNGTKLGGKMLRIHVAATEFHYGVETPASCSPDNIGSVVIDGISFTKRDASGEFAGMERAAVATEYCAMRDNLAFKLTFSLDYNRYSQLADFDREKESLIFNQILSTFRFIESEETAKNETADWKIYRDEKYDFEIKYPRELTEIETTSPEEPIGGIDITISPSGWYKFWARKAHLDEGDLCRSSPFNPRPISQTKKTINGIVFTRSETKWFFNELPRQMLVEYCSQKGDIYYFLQYTQTIRKISTPLPFEEESITESQLEEAIEQSSLGEELITESQLQDRIAQFEEIVSTFRFLK